MIGKIAVSAANFAIDKPYSYVIPQNLQVQPGVRVVVPFGRGNRLSEGVVLSVEEGEEANLKAVAQVLDGEPLLSGGMLRLAAFLRQRCYCSFYDAIRAMLPAGLWFKTTEEFELTQDRSWQEKTLRQKDAAALLQLLSDCGGKSDGETLRKALSDEEAYEKAISYLLSKKWITAQQSYARKTGDKTEKIATLAASLEETMEYAASRPKSAAMQRSVLETVCSVGSVSVKELCY